MYSRQELQERLEQLAAAEEDKDGKTPPPPVPQPSIIGLPHPRDFPNAPPRQPQGTAISTTLRSESRYSDAEAEMMVRADLSKMRKTRAATAAGDWSTMSWNQRLQKMQFLSPEPTTVLPAQRDPPGRGTASTPPSPEDLLPPDNPVPAPYIVPDTGPNPSPYMLPEDVAQEAAEESDPSPYVSPEGVAQEVAEESDEVEAELDGLPPLPDLPPVTAAAERVSDLPDLPDLPDLQSLPPDESEQSVIIAGEPLDDLPDLPKLPCMGWKQTGGCTSQGPREPESDRVCNIKIEEQWSGYCECDWGNHMAVANSCGHPVFTCDEACDGGRDWRPSVEPNSLPLAGEASLLAQLEVPVRGLQEADCPPESVSVYRNVPIVYTWVDGSDGDYQWLRKNYGGVTGGPEDRDSGELRFSWRSLEKYLPWWEGPLFLVSPGAQTPSWADVENNDRLHIVNQDDVYPKAREGTASPLPTFNTNSIEQWLYMVPGLPETARIIVHMNDDYLFVGPGMSDFECFWFSGRSGMAG